MKPEAWKSVGAYMALALLFTVGSLIYGLSGGKAGEFRRWYDGTLEKREIYHKDQVSDRTIYAEDGKTVLRHERYGTWGPMEGKLSSREELLPDGRWHSFEYEAEEKVKSERLKSVTGQQILARDYSNGILIFEEIRTDQGVLVSRKKLTGGKETSALNKDGDMETIAFYPNGNLRYKRTSNLNGTGSEEQFYDDGKTLKEVWVVNAKKVTIRRYSKENKLLWDVDAAEFGEVNITFYDDKGAKEYIQHYHWYSNGIQFHSMTEFDKDGSKCRWVNSAGGYVFDTKYFDKEGRITIHRKLDDGYVIMEEVFDEAGKVKETRKFKYGEGPEDKVDRKRLRWPDTRSASQFEVK